MFVQWVETQINPYPDFAINKKCIDYKQMKQWQTENKLSKEQWLEVGDRGPQKGDKVSVNQPSFEMCWNSFGIDVLMR